mgnify:CR=1 FL=1
MVTSRLVSLISSLSRNWEGSKSEAKATPLEPLDLIVFDDRIDLQKSLFLTGERAGDLMELEHHFY